VVLPQLRPALAAGGLLVALYAISDFGAVALLRYDTLTRALFVRYESGFDFSGASALALVLIGLAFTLIALELWARGERRYHGTRGGSRPASLAPLGRWRWPAFWLVMGLLALALPFVPDGAVPWFLVIAVTAHIGFVAANVFYDAFLPGLTTDATIDRVSSKGFAFGYVGGGLYLVLGVALLLSSGEDGFTGLSTSGATRVVIFGSGLWWMGFALFALRRLPEAGEATPLPAEYQHLRPSRAYATMGFDRTLATARKLAGFPQLLLFVLAFIFYNDGVQTVINISGAYASETLDLGITQIITAFLIVQFVAFGGALFFGMLAERIGAKEAVLWALGVWILIAVMAYFLPAGEALPFYIVAVVVGWVLGGVQALSRSLYATMIPEEASAEFFGFFSVFSKFSAIWGPLVFSIVSHRTGSGRPAILSIVAFFVIGGLLLARVDVDEARASRSRWEGH
jgi:UMF1 family MFS transporter